MKKNWKQNLFDRAWAGIMKQGGPAWNETKEQCEYRTENGRACAVGQLITDEQIKRFCIGN